MKKKLTQLKSRATIFCSNAEIDTVNYSEIIDRFVNIEIEAT